MLINPTKCLIHSGIPISLIWPEGWNTWSYCPLRPGWKKHVLNTIFHMAGSALSSLWEPEASSFHLASTETGFSCVRFWRRGIRQLTYSCKWTNSQKPNRDKKYEPRTVHSQLARMCACVAQWLHWLPTS